MKTTTVLIFLLLIACSGYGQTFQLNEEERFVYKVKQLDEFIERFNGDTKTLVHHYIARHQPQVHVDRVMLLKTTFDAENPAWNLEEVNAFINQVNNKERPVFLNFEDDLWFAETRCLVLYKGKKETVTLILKIEKESGNATKWTLAGAKASFLKDIKPAAATPSDANTDKGVAMNPISHATDFMALDHILKDKKNMSSYMAKGPKNTSLLVFLQEIGNGTIVFKQVNSITYHFLQVDGWGFTVRKFHRASKNSGWLVNQLIKMDPAAKQAYLASVLNIGL